MYTGPCSIGVHDHGLHLVGVRRLAVFSLPVDQAGVKTVQRFRRVQFISKC